MFIYVNAYFISFLCHIDIVSVQLLEEEDGEDGKERRTLRSRLELPVQVSGILVW